MFVLLILAFQSPIIITEVMSNVKGSEQTCGDRNEYIEILNMSPDTIDLADYFLYDFDVNPDEICPWQDSLILEKYPNLKINSTILGPHAYALILDQEYTSTDTSGGNIQPYDLPDSVLILTTDDTTIGNGIQTSDPLIVFSSVNSCTTSFGTPYDTLDCFPYDPGDGISWERIELDMPDQVSNWHVCLAPEGCTPGRENSTVNAHDLAVEANSVVFSPAVVSAGENILIKIQVKNLGLHKTSDYDLVIFDDENNDQTVDQNEQLVLLGGTMIQPLDSAAFSYDYDHPAQGIHAIGFIVEFSEDQNLENNMTFKELKVVGEMGELALSPEIFTPNSDGCADILQIDYRLPDAGGLLSILIFDTRGKLIQRVYNKEYCLKTQGSVYWDGKAGNKKMPTGMYVVYLEYALHNKVTKAKKTTVLAR